MKEERALEQRPRVLFEGTVSKDRSGDQASGGPSDRLNGPDPWLMLLFSVTASWL